MDKFLRQKLLIWQLLAFKWKGEHDKCEAWPNTAYWSAFRSSQLQLGWGSRRRAAPEAGGERQALLRWSARTLTQRDRIVLHLFWRLKRAKRLFAIQAKIVTCSRLAKWSLKGDFHHRSKAICWCWEVPERNQHKQSSVFTSFVFFYRYLFKCCLLFYSVSKSFKTFLVSATSSLPSFPGLVHLQHLSGPDRSGRV